MVYIYMQLDPQGNIPTKFRKDGRWSWSRQTAGKKYIDGRKRGAELDSYPGHPETLVQTWHLSWWILWPPDFRLAMVVPLNSKGCDKNTTHFEIEIIFNQHSLTWFIFFKEFNNKNNFSRDNIFLNFTLSMQVLFFYFSLVDIFFFLSFLQKKQKHNNLTFHSDCLLWR